MSVEIPSIITIHTKYNFRTALLWVYYAASSGKKLPLFAA
jgi:hypothetical protein